MAIELEPTPPSIKPRRRWLWFLVLVAVGEACYPLFNLVYQGVAKAIHDRDGVETKSLTFKHDDGVNDYRGDQFSGTFTLPSGQVATVVVWIQHVSNAKGGEWLYEWSMKKPGQ
jgi:hypothetical protein